MPTPAPTCKCPKRSESGTTFIEVVVALGLVATALGLSFILLSGTTTASLGVMSHARSLASVSRFERTLRYACDHVRPDFWVNAPVVSDDSGLYLRDGSALLARDEDLSALTVYVDQIAHRFPGLAGTEISVARRADGAQTGLVVQVVSRLGDVLSIHCAFGRQSL